MMVPMWTTFKVIDVRAGNRVDELELLSVSQYRGVIPRSEISDAEARAEDLSIYKVCRSGDIVLNRMSAYNGALGLARQGGLVSPDYLVMRPTNVADGKFLTYLIKTSKFIGEMSSRVRGIGSIGGTNVRTPRIGSKEIGSIKVDLPTYDHQRAIASYLDGETAEIDAFIADQEELIALLNERRAATITQAVTKGLDETVSMKDSEVEWLGDVPVSWAVGLCKHLGSITLGKMLQPVQKTSGDVLRPYMRAANVQPLGRLALESKKTMWFSTREADRLDLIAGDVVIVEGGVGGFGRAAYISKDLNGWAFQNSIIRIRPILKSNGRFITYVFLHLRHAGYISMTASATSMPHFTAEKVAATQMAWPEVDEQSAIADYLDQETAVIDATIADASEAIALSKERRAALISAAVTGKIDVRRAAAENMLEGEPVGAA